MRNPNAASQPMAGDPLIGTQLANYRIERVLGRGGMAQVYYGWDVKLNRPVALKVIDARYRGDPTYAKRFVQEAQAVAAWRHENVIQIYYADDQAGLYYYAMEFIDGSDLGQLLAQYNADRELMPHADVLRIGRAVASALDYAHSRGVIHRDVKPSNVMIARGGRVVLGDFGLALDVQLGSIGEAFGSPHYMAPEQARRSTDAVAQSDLYSLGVILYEMLTGTVPFDDPSPTTVALQHMTLPPTPPRMLNPRLSQEVEGVLLRALSKQPDQRFPTGRALMGALEAGLVQGAAPAVSEGITTPGPAAVPPRPVSQISVDDRVALTPPAPQVRPSGASYGAGPRSAEGAPARGPERPPPAGGVYRPAPIGAPPRYVPPAAAAPRPAPQPAGLGRMLLLAGLALLTLLALAVGLAFALSPNRRANDGAGAAPTVLYPDGLPFVLFYNANSLYLLNLSQTEAEVAPLAFERLDAAGQPAGRFEGARWAEFYPTVEPGWCMRLEVLNSGPYLEPAECFQGYLSTRTPSAGDPAIFWTPQEGSQQFRVLWDEAEIGRCEIAAGLCRVFLPR